MNQRKFRIDLSYVGTEFQGWQVQPEQNSVQDHLNRALSTALREEVKSLGSSRTDSGVHAEHQVATFSSSASFDRDILKRSLNALLPRGITVSRLSLVEGSFHPILDAKAKLYRYSLHLGTSVSPFVRDYVWHVHGVDLGIVKSSLGRFQGRHDFTSFCAKDSSAKTFSRHILETYSYEEGEYFHIFILGEGFLKQMVRNIVGTLVDFGQGKLDPKSLDHILTSRNRNLAGRTAPAQGLSLLQVFYDTPHQIQEFLGKAKCFKFLV